MSDLKNLRRSQLARKAIDAGAPAKTVGTMTHPQLVDLLTTGITAAKKKKKKKK